MWRMEVAATAAVTDGVVLWGIGSGSFPDPAPAWWTTLADATTGLLVQGPSIPNDPSGLTIDSASGGAHSTWSAPSNTIGLEGYLIESSTDNVNWSIVGAADPSNRKFFDHRVNGSGGAKYYRVFSLNQYALSTGVASNSLTHLYRNGSDLNLAASPGADLPDLTSTSEPKLFGDHYDFSTESYLTFNNVMLDSNSNQFQVAIATTDVDSAMALSAGTLELKADCTSGYSGGVTIASGPLSATGQQDGVAPSGVFHYTIQSMPLTDANFSGLTFGVPHSLTLHFSDLKNQVVLYSFQFSTAPIGLTADEPNASTNHVQLHWTANRGSSITYNVYRNDTNSPVASGLATNTYSGSITAGELDRFYVQANIPGGDPSPLSQAAAVLLGSTGNDLFKFKGNLGQISFYIGSAATPSYSGLTATIGSLSVDTRGGVDTIEFGKGEGASGVPFDDSTRGLSLNPGRYVYLYADGGTGNSLTLNVKGGYFYNPPGVNMYDIAPNLTINGQNGGTLILTHSQSFSSLELQDNATSIFASAQSIGSITSGYINQRLIVTNSASYTLSGSQGMGNIIVDHNAHLTVNTPLSNLQSIFVGSGGSAIFNDDVSITFGGDITVDNRAISSPATAVTFAGNLSAAYATVNLLGSATALFSGRAVIATMNVALPAFYASATFSGTVTSGNPAATIGALNIAHSGTVTITSPSTISNTPSASIGILTTREDGLLTLATGHSGNIKLVLGQLDMGTTSIGGKIDLGDNAMIINYSGSSPLPNIRSYLIAGRNTGGTWDGTTGIASATANSNSSTHALGCAENRLIPSGSYTSFMGQTVGSNSILIRYVPLGDANLDNSTDTADKTIVYNHYYQSTGNQWYLGDFNYDSVCNEDDATAASVPVRTCYGIELLDAENGFVRWVFSATTDTLTDATGLKVSIDGGTTWFSPSSASLDGDDNNVYTLYYATGDDEGPVNLSGDVQYQILPASVGLTFTGGGVLAHLIPTEL